MKKFLLIFLTLVLSLFSAFALESVYDVFPLLSDSEIKLLIENGETLENSTLQDGIIQLAPKGTKAYEQAKEASELDNSFSVGVVSLVAYPDDWKDLSLEEKQLKVFNIMTKVSTQQGITYISRMAGYTEKTLIEESYCISDPDKKNSKIQDPVFRYVPGLYSMHSYQKDNRFGGNVFKLDYTNTEDEVFLSIVNKTAMKFMGVSCVLKGKLAMYIDTYLTEEGIVVFSMATIVDKKPQIKLVVYTVDLEESFQRRINGFKNWFISSVQ